MKLRNRQEISTQEQTRCQVALTRGSEVLYVYGYTARKTKAGIFAICVGQDATSLLTESESAL